jgi:hypothetical protein
MMLTYYWMEILMNIAQYRCLVSATCRVKKGIRVLIKDAHLLLDGNSDKYRPI